MEGGTQLEDNIPDRGSQAHDRFYNWIWPPTKEKFGTQAALADACDVTESYISKILNGKRPPGLLIVLPKLISARAFKSKEEVFAGLELIHLYAFGKRNPRKKLDEIKTAVTKAFDNLPELESEEDGLINDMQTIADIVDKWRSDGLI